MQGEVREVEGNVFRKIWKVKAPSTLKALAWRVFLNKVQTKTELVKRNALPPNSTTTCGLYQLGEETVNHLFGSYVITWKGLYEVV